MRLILSVGGTGGHMFAARQLAEQVEGELLVAGHGLKYLAGCEISSGRRPWPLLKGIWQGIKLIRRFRPDAVVGFGSFHSAPLLAAAVLLRVPIFLHESNRHPGKCNRLFSRFARGMGVHFPGKGTLIEPLCHRNRVTREEAAEYYGLDPAKPTLLVFGGSQGAEAIERAIPDLEGWQQLRLTSSADPTPHRVVKRFEERMEMAWSLADLVIGRAGGLTCAELVQYRVPAILIPWPEAAEDHQRHNGEALMREGGAIVLPEEELTRELLERTIASIDRTQMAGALDRLATLPRSNFLDWIRDELSLHRHRRHRHERTGADPTRSEAERLGKRPAPGKASPES